MKYNIEINKMDEEIIRMKELLSLHQKEEKLTHAILDYFSSIRFGPSMSIIINKYKERLFQLENVIKQDEEILDIIIEYRKYYHELEMAFSETSKKEDLL